ncbi:MAG: D-alanine--D-alanine ligase [Polaribacter sp.]|nr:D-alanine--D-alanine ligase [Polaribacter sp.]
MNTTTNIKKLYQWEHWPASMFYIPNLPYAFYLAIRAKHTAFFSAANPCIKSSGNGTESKFTTTYLIPEKFRPKTILVTKNTPFEVVISKIKKHQITYPLIAKPDIGFRGLLVQKINSQTALKTYLETYPIAILIQEFLEYTNECGIFYHRKPNKEKGCISSITLKRFLNVVGDGNSSVKELILADNRAKRYLDLFQKIHQEKLDKTPKKGEKITLTAIGNHSKGTQFINGNHLISKKLEQTFNALSASIPGWYYGRVDVKYNDFSALENGTDFKILEINGILSEPTHMYDAENYTYLKALKTIRTHWKALFEIAVTNHTTYQVPYKSPTLFIKEMLALRAYTKKMKKLSKTN